MSGQLSRSSVGEYQADERAGVGNLPMNFEESLGPNFTTYKESFLKAAYDYCDEHNMKINGDIIALRILVAADEKHDTQTLLLNVPVGNL